MDKLIIFITSLTNSVGGGSNGDESLPPAPPLPSGIRITEEGDTRVTEEGDIRVIES